MFNSSGKLLLLCSMTYWRVIHTKGVVLPVCMMCHSPEDLNLYINMLKLWHMLFWSSAQPTFVMRCRANHWCNIVISLSCNPVPLGAWGSNLFARKFPKYALLLRWYVWTEANDWLIPLVCDIMDPPTGVIVTIWSDVLYKTKDRALRVFRLSKKNGNVIND